MQRRPRDNNVATLVRNAFAYVNCGMTLLNCRPILVVSISPHPSFYTFPIHECIVPNYLHFDLFPAMHVSFDENSTFRRYGKRTQENVARRQSPLALLRGHK